MKASVTPLRLAADWEMPDSDPAALIESCKRTIRFADEGLESLEGECELYFLYCDLERECTDAIKMARSRSRNKAKRSILSHCARISGLVKEILKLRGEQDLAERLVAT